MFDESEVIQVLIQDGWHRVDSFELGEHFASYREIGKVTEVWVPVDKLYAVRTKP